MRSSRKFFGRRGGNVYGPSILKARLDPDPGGFLIVDDYGAMPPCKQAVEDYRRDHGIREPIRRIDWTGVYWREGADGEAL